MILLQSISQFWRRYPSLVTVLFFSAFFSFFEAHVFIYDTFSHTYGQKAFSQCLGQCFFLFVSLAFSVYFRLLVTRSDCFWVLVVLLNTSIVSNNHPPRTQVSAHFIINAYATIRIFLFHLFHRWIIASFDWWSYRCFCDSQKFDAFHIDIDGKTVECWRIFPTRFGHWCRIRNNANNETQPDTDAILWCLLERLNSHLCTIIWAASNDFKKLIGI